MPHLKHLSANARSSGEKDIHSAVALCRLRGARMTSLRIAVLKALWGAGRPLGAYEMRDLVSEASGREIAAPSIYRTLDFLCEQGVAARIESRNAYVACRRPEHDHACVFLVCETCGGAKEIENPNVERLINEDAKRLGFAVRHRVVELSGYCAPCQETL
ncbi:MAG: Fur family transcriptional regulator [Pseudomonadota bacterium]